ncbi:MAG: N-formylglutamate amidohydrolase [Motiliproteus sp.]|nr:N-formylglutamate amidohydrolase [Motiliproteus sp.]
MSTPTSNTGKFLKADDPDAFQVINPNGRTPLLIVCDHASNFIPDHLNNLGMDAQLLEDHIAWDPGSADVANLISQRLDCRALLANYSRLLIDVNRDPLDNDPTMIPEVSDDYPIPGNQNLNDQQKQQRIDELLEPYHQGIEQQLQSLHEYSPAPLLFSIHTFTPAMQGCNKPRPWHAGMLWNADPRIAMPLMRHLQQHDHLIIGDNEPYSAREVAYTIDRHGHAHGYPNCAIEIRQDLLKDHADCLWWAERLAEGLQKVLDIEEVQQVQYFQLEA